MSRSDQLLRWVALLVAVASLACASPGAGPHGAETQAAAEARSSADDQDVRPSYFSSAEVDVPARPLAPIEPVYPAQLLAMGVEGDVSAQVVVLADGSVGGAQLESSSDRAFTLAVQDALQVARFHPAERRGRHVASWVMLEWHFRLE